MRRILFVTNRNILTTSGELRLIKNRAESLYNDHRIPTDFFAFSYRDRIHSNERERINAGGTVDAFEFNLTNPIITFISYIRLKKAIINKLQTDRYGAVVLSGTGMPWLANWIKNRYNTKIYLDIHGALEDILEVSKKEAWIKSRILRIMYHIDKIAVKQGIKNSDGVFVVTEALEMYLRERYSVPKDKRFYIVPCATSTKPIDEKEYREDRKCYREKYGITDEEIVFIYSGGVSTWQCISETIDLYKCLSNKTQVKTRLLVFSHSIDRIKTLAKDDERIQIDSYSPDELYHALRMGDYAFLLRKDNMTNNVAFPNKYLEYVQSGMRIITTPYVKEIAKQVQMNDLGYIYDFESNVDNLLNYIINEERNQPNWDRINAVLTKNSFSETTKEFAERFLNGQSDN